MLKTIFNKIQTKATQENTKYKAYFYNFPQPVWTDRNYEKFAQESYMRNVIAFRCINLIARSAGSIAFKLYQNIDNQDVAVDLKTLPFLTKPNKIQTISLLLQELYSYLLISGNAFLFLSKDKQGNISGIECIRPDLVQVLLSDDEEMILGYRYKTRHIQQDYLFNKNTGKCDILHIKNFHPLSAAYGLSPIDPARYAIDQHNNLSAYNKALLQNSARPSGALVVNATQYNNGGILTDEQYERLKNQMEEQFTGSLNAGKPILLEGGLDWKEMSISPKDMDFIENKNSCAREIALAFGVPPHLLGLPGDNTYANMAEARASLWEETIIPLSKQVCDSIWEWVKPHLQPSLAKLKLEIDTTTPLSKHEPINT